jgi:hypothetical protein
MNIDERLEALAQSVELLSLANKDNEANIARLIAMQEETDRRFAEVARLFAETHDFINRLAHVAEAHEQRLDNLEKR